MFLSCYLCEEHVFSESVSVMWGHSSQLQEKSHDWESVDEWHLDVIVWFELSGWEKHDVIMVLIT